MAVNSTKCYKLSTPGRGESGQLEGNLNHRQSAVNTQRYRLWTPGREEGQLEGDLKHCPAVNTPENNYVMKTYKDYKVESTIDVLWLSNKAFSDSFKSQACIKLLRRFFNNIRVKSSGSTEAQGTEEGKIDFSEAKVYFLVLFGLMKWYGKNLESLKQFSEAHDGYPCVVEHDPPNKTICVHDWQVGYGCIYFYISHSVNFCKLAVPIFDYRRIEKTLNIISKRIKCFTTTKASFHIGHIFHDYGCLGRVTTRTNSVGDGHRFGKNTRFLGNAHIGTPGGFACEGSVSTYTKLLSLYKGNPQILAILKELHDMYDEACQAVQVQRQIVSNAGDKNSDGYLDDALRTAQLCLKNVTKQFRECYVVIRNRSNANAVGEILVDKPMLGCNAYVSKKGRICVELYTGLKRAAENYLDKLKGNRDLKNKFSRKFDYFFRLGNEKEAEYKQHPFALSLSKFAYHFNDILYQYTKKDSIFSRKSRSINCIKEVPVFRKYGVFMTSAETKRRMTKQHIYEGWRLKDNVLAANTANYSGKGGKNIETVFSEFVVYCQSSSGNTYSQENITKKLYNFVQTVKESIEYFSILKGIEVCPNKNISNSFQCEVQKMTSSGVKRKPLEETSGWMACLWDGLMMRIRGYSSTDSLVEKIIRDIQWSKQHGLSRINPKAKKAFEKKMHKEECKSTKLKLWDKLRGRSASKEVKPGLRVTGDNIMNYFQRSDLVHAGDHNAFQRKKGKSIEVQVDVDLVNFIIHACFSPVAGIVNRVVNTHATISAGVNFSKVKGVKLLEWRAPTANILGHDSIRKQYRMYRHTRKKNIMNEAAYDLSHRYQVYDRHFLVFESYHIRKGYRTSLDVGVSTVGGNSLSAVNASKATSCEHSCFIGLVVASFPERREKTDDMRATTRIKGGRYVNEQRCSMRSIIKKVVVSNIDPRDLQSEIAENKSRTINKCGDVKHVPPNSDLFSDSCPLIYQHSSEHKQPRFDRNGNILNLLAKSTDNRGEKLFERDYDCIVRNLTECQGKAGLNNAIAFMDVYTQEKTKTKEALSIMISGRKSKALYRSDYASRVRKYRCNIRVPTFSSLNVVSVYIQDTVIEYRRATSDVFKYGYFSLEQFIEHRLLSVGTVVQEGRSAYIGGAKAMADWAQTDVGSVDFSGGQMRQVSSNKKQKQLICEQSISYISLSHDGSEMRRKAKGKCSNTRGYKHDIQYYNSFVTLGTSVPIEQLVAFLSLYYKSCPKVNTSDKSQTLKQLLSSDNISVRNMFNGKEKIELKCLLGTMLGKLSGVICSRDKKTTVQGGGDEVVNQFGSTKQWIAISNFGSYLQKRNKKLVFIDDVLSAYFDCVKTYTIEYKNGKDSTIMQMLKSFDDQSIFRLVEVVLRRTALLETIRHACAKICIKLEEDQVETGSRELKVVEKLEACCRSTLEYYRYDAKYAYIWNRIHLLMVYKDKIAPLFKHLGITRRLGLEYLLPKGSEEEIEKNPLAGMLGDLSSQGIMAISVETVFEIKLNSQPDGKIGLYSRNGMLYYYPNDKAQNFGELQLPHASLREECNDGRNIGIKFVYGMKDQASEDESVFPLGTTCIPHCRIFTVDFTVKNEEEQNVFSGIILHKDTNPQIKEKYPKQPSTYDIDRCPNTILMAS